MNLFVGLGYRKSICYLGIIEGIGNNETTILLSSHYLEEVDELADEMAIIDKGQVIANGKPEDLKKSLVETELHLGFVSSVMSEAESVKINKKYQWGFKCSCQ